MVDQVVACSGHACSKWRQRGYVGWFNHG